MAAQIQKGKISSMLEAIGNGFYTAVTFLPEKIRQKDMKSEFEALRIDVLRKHLDEIKDKIDRLAGRIVLRSNLAQDPFKDPKYTSVSRFKIELARISSALETDFNNARDKNAFAQHIYAVCKQATVAVNDLRVMAFNIEVPSIDTLVQYGPTHAHTQEQIRDLQAGLRALVTALDDSALRRNPVELAAEKKLRGELNNQLNQTEYHISQMNSALKDDRHIAAKIKEQQNIKITVLQDGEQRTQEELRNLRAKIETLESGNFDNKTDDVLRRQQEAFERQMMRIEDDFKKREEARERNHQEELRRAREREEALQKINEQLQQRNAEHIRSTIDKTKELTFLYQEDLKKAKERDSLESRVSALETTLQGLRLAELQKQLTDEHNRIDVLTGRFDAVQADFKHRVVHSLFTTPTKGANPGNGSTPAKPN